ncbi:hypothetical protein GCM10020255_073940 [Rhodococcus baikonurensis]
MKRVVTDKTASSATNTSRITWRSTGGRVEVAGDLFEGRFTGAGSVLAKRCNLLAQPGQFGTLVLVEWAVARAVCHHVPLRRKLLPHR